MIIIDLGSGAISCICQHLTDKEILNFLSTCKCLDKIKCDGYFVFNNQVKLTKIRKLRYFHNFHNIIDDDKNLFDIVTASMIMEHTFKKASFDTTNIGKITQDYMNNFPNGYFPRNVKTIEIENHPKYYKKIFENYRMEHIKWINHFNILDDDNRSMYLGDICDSDVFKFGMEKIYPGDIPNGVETFQFPTSFDGMFTQNVFPDTLKHIVLYSGDDFSFDPKLIPKNVTHLECDYFDEIPSSITHLFLKERNLWSWNDDNYIPESVVHIVLDKCYITDYRSWEALSLEREIIPTSATHLILNNCSKMIIAKNSIPGSVTHLEINDCKEISINIGSIPNSVTHFSVKYPYLYSKSKNTKKKTRIMHYVPVLLQDVIPESVTHLEIDAHYVTNGRKIIPKSVIYLTIFNAEPGTIEFDRFPKNVKYVTIYMCITNKMYFYDMEKERINNMDDDNVSDDTSDYVVSYSDISDDDSMSSSDTSDFTE